MLLLQIDPYLHKKYYNFMVCRGVQISGVVFKMVEREDGGGLCFTNTITESSSGNVDIISLLTCLGVHLM
jgi:hypothetical protein